MTQDLYIKSFVVRVSIRYINNFHISVCFVWVIYINCFSLFRFLSEKVKRFRLIRPFCYFLSLLSAPMIFYCRRTSEVNGPTAICIKRPEDDLTELVSTASGKYLVVHFNKLILGKLPVWAVLHKASMPFLR